MWCRAYHFVHQPERCDLSPLCCRLRPQPGRVHQHGRQQSWCGRHRLQPHWVRQMFLQGQVKCETRHRRMSSRGGLVLRLGYSSAGRVVTEYAGNIQQPWMDCRELRICKLAAYRERVCCVSNTVQVLIQHGTGTDGHGNYYAGCAFIGQVLSKRTPISWGKNLRDSISSVPQFIRFPVLRHQEPMVQAALFALS